MAIYILKKVSQSWINLIFSVSFGRFMASCKTEFAASLNAFFDCSNLELIVFGYTPPILSEGVFLGNTPSAFRIGRPSSSAAKYNAWLVENATRFNNNGTDTIFVDW